MSLAEDVERVREYVRTLGRDDFFRMYEDGAEHLLSNANEDQHRTGILGLVVDDLTVTVGRGSAERERHQQPGQPV